MTIARHAPSYQFACIGSLLAGRTAPHAVHDHGLAISCGRDLTNLGGPNRAAMPVLPSIPLPILAPPDFKLPTS
jgi:hypothetical protein